MTQRSWLSEEWKLWHYLSLGIIIGMNISVDDSLITYSLSTVRSVSSFITGSAEAKNYARENWKSIIGTMSAVLWEWLYRVNKSLVMYVIYIVYNVYVYVLTCIRTYIHSSSNFISRRIHKTYAQHYNNDFTKCIPLAVAREAQRLIELTTATYTYTTGHRVA